MTTGLELIAAERKRQIEKEGWTAHHDDMHFGGALALAGRSYREAAGPESPMPGIWPWERKWWKPADRKRNLIKAGALFQAEDDRYTRIGAVKSAQRYSQLVRDVADEIDRIESASQPT